jgi:hypothetical protein
MYPDGSNFNWAGVLAGLGTTIGSAISGQPAQMVSTTPVGFAPYNYGATAYNPYGSIFIPSPTKQPTLFDSNYNSGLLSGTSGSIVLIVAIVIGVVLLVR